MPSHRRPRILGFGPIGAALLLPLAALIWVAWTGYDLQHQLLRLVDALFGWDGLAYFITRIVAGHFFSLHLPMFGLIALCVALVPLHLAPRHPSRWVSPALLAWALTAPTLPWVLLASRPTGVDVATWRFLLEATGTVGAAAILALATGSWRIGAVVCIAGVTAHGLVLFDERLMNPGLRAGIATSATIPGLALHTAAFYGWHLALGAALSWWAFNRWRCIKPEHACQWCGYDLRGLVAATCPECGAAPSTPAAPRARAAAPPPPAPAGR